MRKRWSNFVSGILLRTILLIIVMVVGMLFIYLWYEASTKREFEKTYYFLKNIPPYLIWENQKAFKTLMKTLPSSYQFNSSKMSKDIAVKSI